LFFNEKRVWSSRSIISFYVNWKIWTSSYHYLLRGKHPFECFGYWGGLECRAEGAAVGVGLVIYKGLFCSSFLCLSCGLQRMASIYYLNSNCGAILRWKIICMGTFVYSFYFYRESLTGVGYCNLRNPVKATSLGHPRHIEARSQYKAFNINTPEDWKVQIPSRKKKTLGSCLLANSKQPL
jgi:hypothetical protein